MSPVPSGGGASKVQQVKTTSDPGMGTHRSHEKPARLPCNEERGRRRGSWAGSTLMRVLSPVLILPAASDVGGLLIGHLPVT